MAYKTTVSAQLWTKSENKAEVIPANTIIDVSGKTQEIKGRLCWEISSVNYPGKYIEPKYLAEYNPEPPPTEPPSDVTVPDTLEARDMRLIALDAEGNLIGEYKSVGTIYLRRVTE